MHENVSKQLGRRIQYLRKQKGYSQEKFAEAINIATTSLSFIETGRGFMSLPTLLKMTEILDVELYEIFQFVSPKTNEEMYNYLIKTITSIKNDTDKLKTVYSILKNIV